MCVCVCVKKWRQELVSWAVLEISSQKKQQHQYLLTMQRCKIFHYLITVTLPGVIFYSNIQIDYSAYRIDLHGLSHVALAHLKQQSSCTGRLFPADALTTRLNSFFSVFTHQFLVTFHYILLDFRTFTIIPQDKV